MQRFLQNHRGEWWIFCAEVKSLLWKLIFTHFVSCWSCSHFSLIKLFLNSWMWTRNSWIWNGTFEFQFVLLSFQFVISNSQLVTRKTMLWYCLKCRKNTESKNPRVEKTKNRRIMLSSNCAVCGSKKSIFIKEQKLCGLLTALFGVKSPFVGIPILGNII